MEQGDRASGRHGRGEGLELVNGGADASEVGDTPAYSRPHRLSQKGVVHLVQLHADNDGRCAVLIKVEPVPGGLAYNSRCQSTRPPLAVGPGPDNGVGEGQGVGLRPCQGLPLLRDVRSQVRGA